jgi:hypothetical protein
MAISLRQGPDFQLVIPNWQLYLATFPAAASIVIVLASPSAYPFRFSSMAFDRVESEKLSGSLEV